MAKNPLTPAKLRGQTAAELKARLEESKQHLFRLRVRTTTKEQHDAMEIRRTRRNVARILTVLGEKKKAGQ